MHEGILNGIRILDFTRILAGPYATRLLADFGAEVIKVQSKKTLSGIEENNNAYFRIWNRNKLSITLDMSFPESRDIILRLIAKCDVVIDNFSPRVMSNWELEYKDIKKFKKDIIAVSMSGFGQTGPWKNFTAYSPTIQSLAGHTFLSSYNEDHPAGPGFAEADITAALYSAFVILAALEYRDRSGEGQFIDMSEYECACTTLGPALMYQSISKNEISPQGNTSDFIQAAPYGCYKCSGNDRWCVIAIFTETEWKALCEVMDNPAWVNEDKYSTLMKRKSNEIELNKHIGDWTIKYPPEYIVKRLHEANIRSSVVCNADDIANDPHLISRGYFMEIKDNVSGTMITDTCPIKMIGSDAGSGKFAQNWKLSPSLGEDNIYVYRDLLGFSNNEINSLIKKGILN